ncbi:MAG: CoA transferase [Polyangiales bacterium]
MKLLRGTRVIELDGPFGSSCARFLGSLGAEVVKVVAPGAEQGLDPLTAFEDEGKQRIALDLDAPDDVDALRALAARADFLIESAPLGVLAASGLDYAALSAINPRLIHASITAFGSSGPYASYRGSELVASAMGGVLRGRVTADGVPVKEALDACAFHAAATAAASMLLAYHELRRSGRGQHVDVSLYEVTATRSARAILRWQFARAEALGEAADERAPREPPESAGSLLRWLRTGADDEPPAPGERGALRTLAGTNPAEVPDRFLKVSLPAPRPQWTSRWTPRSRDVRAAASAFAWDVQRGAPRCGALVGVKVLDLSSGVASALASKALAEHGAQVVRLEASARAPDDAPWRAHLDTSKLSLRMHLSHPRAGEVLEPLLDWADVLLESETASPAGLEGASACALDGASAHARRGELVVVRARPHAQALAGHTLLEPEGARRASTPQVAYDDAITAPFLVAAVAAALAQRRRTGIGCRVEAAAHALCAHQLVPALLAAQGACDAPPRMEGNGDARVLAQGVYPARGSDRWIAITLCDAADLARLAALAGGDFPTADAVRDDPAARAALDARIAGFTASRDDHALMQALQAHGLAAGVVQDAEDLLARDRHLANRGALVQLTHPQLGRFVHQASPYPLGSSPASLRTAPLPGQHTDYVCRELLGLDDDTLAALRDAGLFF